MSVYDEETAEEVCFIDEPMMSQDSRDTEHTDGDNEPTYQRLMRKFHSERHDFEDTNYQKESAE